MSAVDDKRIIVLLLGELLKRFAVHQPAVHCQRRLTQGHVCDDVIHRRPSYPGGISIEDDDPNVPHMSAKILEKDRTHCEKVEQEGNMHWHATMAGPKHRHGERI